MPKPTKGPRLGGSPSHQRLILANLATQLFEHRRITTTEAKARALRPVAEKLITKAKKGDLHNRRLVQRTLRDKSVVWSLFHEIAPTFTERPGGYTRITKVGPRKGDNAPMAVIELVTEAYEPKRATKRARPVKKTTPAPTATQEPPTQLTDEASPEASVVAEEQPGADQPAAEPAPGSEDSADADADDTESAAEASDTTGTTGSDARTAPN